MEVVEGVVSEVVPLLVGLPGNAGGLQPLGNRRPSVAGVPGVVGRIGYSSSLGAGRIRRQDRLGRIGRKWLVSGVSRDPNDRKSVGVGKSVSGGVEFVGRRIINKKTYKN